eukprot:Blabericola_migrator_1__6218@NODE_3139_length_2012_cov_20_110026_g852_i2_p1_GENE_NODE_3139_length_2012_cov_20_110026_g852_i2NODE_3139_length_2012_cov_20_110026_g852_i2_p1_ORF_typecomplete_len507_score88_04DUF2935/PF11155_8/3_1e02DUF2935/PF11155_8/0_99DUF3958/PF13125_6/0_11SlyX/PF04102_12/1_2SlyX/PF04102_12/3_3e03SesA/PF17107_5/1_2e04SesA/PF17107_5/2_5e03SesA/PF17107_5/0_24_NODE_3139_length_2012_cov_20_110026_g852_i22021722
MARHLIEKQKHLSLKSISDLAVLLSVACPFTEQDLQYFLERFSNRPDTQLEYSIAVREYLRAALLSCVTPKGIRPIEGVTPDIRIEQWDESLMYKVKRVSSTKLSLEASWQAFVQSLNEHLGSETDKGFVHMQLLGRPFKVYARKESPSTLEVGVPSSHRIEEFRELLERDASSASLDSAKAFNAAFWNEYWKKYSTEVPELTTMRHGALMTIKKACILSHKDDFQSEEWVSPPTRRRAQSQDRCEAVKLADERLAEAREDAVSELESAEAHQQDKIMELLRVIARDDFRVGIKPWEIYLSNLKCWKERLTELLDIERVQTEHCWQVALDFVRQQFILYSRWPENSHSSERTLIDNLKLWCKNIDKAKSHVQTLQEKTKADAETHPHFQKFVDIILQRSQRCLDYFEEEKRRLEDSIDNLVKVGTSRMRSYLEEFESVVSCLENDWDSDEVREATEAREGFYDCLIECRAICEDRGMEEDPVWPELEDECSSINWRFSDVKDAHRG